MIHFNEFVGCCCTSAVKLAACVLEHVDPPTSPLYVERDAKERNFDNTGQAFIHVAIVNVPLEQRVAILCITYNLLIILQLFATEEKHLFIHI